MKIQGGNIQWAWFFSLCIYIHSIINGRSNTVLVNTIFWIESNMFSLLFLWLYEHQVCCEKITLPISRDKLYMFSSAHVCVLKTVLNLLTHKYIETLSQILICTFIFKHKNQYQCIECYFLLLFFSAESIFKK